MAALVQDTFTLSSEELKELTRLEKEQTRLIRERVDIAAQKQRTEADLEQARERHKAACVAVAAGKRTDVEECAAEMRRLEAMIDGFRQLTTDKTAELRDSSAALDALTQKRDSLVAAAERERLEENLRVCEATEKAARENLPKLEAATRAARIALNAFKNPAGPLR